MSESTLQAWVLRCYLQVKMPKIKAVRCLSDHTLRSSSGFATMLPSGAVMLAISS